MHFLFHADLHSFCLSQMYAQVVQWLSSQFEGIQEHVEFWVFSSRVYSS